MRNILYKLITFSFLIVVGTGLKGVPIANNYFGIDRPNKLYIISIGVDNHGSAYAWSDAQEIPKVLENHLAAGNLGVNKIIYKAINSTSKDSINSLISSWKHKIKPEDTFVFYYGGVSVPTEEKPVDLNFFIKKLNDKDLITQNDQTSYFTFTELMAWADLIPAEKQLLILEAGNNEPIKELIEQTLLNSSPVENILSKRNRVFLTTNGFGQESAQHGSGYLLYMLQNFKTMHDIPNKQMSQRNGISIFNVFLPNLRDEVFFEFDRITVEHNLRLLRKPYQKIIYEDEIRKYLARAKEWFYQPDSGASRGTGVFVQPKAKKKLFTFNKYALVIGINEYDAEEWPDLINPINDAKTIHQALIEDYGFQSKLLENPTKEELLTELLKYQQVITDTTSQFFFFFAGHGDFEKPFEGTLITKNTKSKAEDPLRSSYITHANLRNYLNYIPSKHLLVVLDACFGGTFDQALSNSGSRSGLEMYQDAERDQFVTRKMKYRSRLYLTSGGKEYVPDGRPGMHSPFARRFISALRENTSGEGILTMNEIKTYLEKVTPEPKSGEFGTNEPGADFLFIRSEK